MPCRIQLYKNHRSGNFSRNALQLFFGQAEASPHFSRGFYCGGTEDHVYRVRMVFMRALPQTPRHTVQVCLRGLQSRACKPSDVFTALCTASLGNPVRNAG
jgi:hypothetical protein